MRKEAKRSLLIWPATASAAISAMSWILIASESPSLPRRPLIASPSPEAVALDLDVAAIATGIELSARSEYGSRAMKLPERVAQLISAPSEIVEAPVVDANRELAGLVLLEDNASKLANHQDRDGIVTQQSEIDAAASPAVIGPSRPEFWEPEIVFLDPPDPTPRSILPQSNRALGKRVLTPAQPESVESTLTADVQRHEELENVVAPQGVTAAPQPVTGESISRPGNASPVGVADAPAVESQVDAGTAGSRPPGSGNPAGWPVTRRLDEQLQALSDLASSPSDSPLVDWSETVSQKLGQLQRLPRLGDPRAGALIDELSDLAREGSRRAERWEDRGQQIQWLCASYAIARRVAVWRPVWEVTNRDESTWMAGDVPDRVAESIENAVDSVRADLETTGDAGGWARYLLLDQIQSAIAGDNNRGQNDSADRADLEERIVLAQRFLSRLQWHALADGQREWLKRDSITRLANVIRPWAQDAVDYANLLGQIERQESDAIDMAAIDIAGAVQTLRFAANPKAVKIADSVNTHYRNANVRIALSQPMLQRLLPTVDPKSVPVRMHLFGSRVRGMSQVENDLQVELTPSPDRWTLHLQAIGQVRTQSTGFNGPVAVRTSGNSQFIAATPIEVTRRGIQLGDASVDVRGNTRLRGIRTDYDGWPLIGSLVQSIAASRYDSLAPRSNRIANQRAQAQIGSEIDTQLDQRLGVATELLSEMVLGPLGKLQLDPQVTDMQTTDLRLLARYRLAGDWQLGAFTARPRTPRTSLMSIQVHQSAVNNTLEQLIPRDDSLTIHEMIRSGAATFGQTDVTIPDDIPGDVTVLFSRTRPITVEIEEGQLWVTLRIVRLNRGDRVDLTRFIVRAAYRPEMHGMEAYLVRDGHLRISGPGMSMRERLPIRAIFNKVLSPNRPLRLTLPQLIEHPAAEGLAVSQLELRGGWIGMAISENDEPRIALQRK